DAGRERQHEPPLDLEKLPLRAVPASEERDREREPRLHRRDQPLVDADDQRHRAPADAGDDVRAAHEEPLAEVDEERAWVPGWGRGGHAEQSGAEGQRPPSSATSGTKRKSRNSSRWSVSGPVRVRRSIVCFSASPTGMKRRSPGRSPSCAQSYSRRGTGKTAPNADTTSPINTA